MSRATCPAAIRVRPVALLVTTAVAFCGLALTGVAVFGAGFTGVARAAAPDLLAGALAPGAAEVNLGPEQGVWGPLLHLDLSFRVTARFRGHHKVGSTARLWVRIQSPRARCAASYARDRGEGIITSYVGVHRITRTFGIGGHPAGIAGRIDSAGNMLTPSIQWGGSRFNRPRTLRFCIWMVRSANARIRPIVQDIPLQARLFGAADAEFGSLFPYPGSTSLGSAATFPLRAVESRASSEPGCQEPTMVFDGTHRETGDLYVGNDSGGDQLGYDCASDSSVTDSYAPLIHGSPGASLGSVTWTASDQAAPPASAPVPHIGDCYLESGLLQRTVAEAAAYIEAVGCHPGRTIYLAAPTPTDGYPEPHGSVYAFAVHGGSATLVPPGTSVDMVVNP